MNYEDRPETSGVSSCCGAPVYTDMGICSGCGDPCDTEEELDEEEVEQLTLDKRREEAEQADRAEREHEQELRGGE